jgi:zinc/manganese transport system ATP-binding protein
MINNIVLSNLTIAYERHPAIHHLSGAFTAGSMTAILGPNGAGKTTLLKAIVGLIKPTSGTINIISQHQGAKSRKISYLPQFANLNSQFPLTVWQAVLLGFWHDIGYTGRLAKEHEKKALLALQKVGMQAFLKRKVSTLSAGQLQRIMFARIIAQNSEIVLLDEPFSAIDAETTTGLLKILHEWNAEGKTIICVLHDIKQINDNFPMCLLLSRELISWGETKKVLSAENLRKAHMLHPIWDEKAEVCSKE